MPSVIETYSARRAALIETAAPGLEAARALSSITDEAVAALAQQAATDTGVSGVWAVCALGGWGAGALLPGSDLDLLVLSDAPAADLKPFVERMLYPLWDAGLAVGHQVRRPREHVADCRKGDLETLTASLTARVVAGAIDYATGALETVAAHARRDSRTVLKRLAERPRPGSPFLLEPDLKHGAGGQRDYDELIWTAAVLTGSVRPAPEALVSLELLNEADCESLLAARERIATARWRLHSEGAGDLMGLETAAARNEAGAVHESLAMIWVALNRVRRRLAGVRGTAQHDDSSLSHENVFRLLDQGMGACPALEEAAYLGHLENIVPSLRDLMALRRPGLGHRLTVGAHSIATACTIADLRRSEGPVARSAGMLPDLRVVQLAALVHDAGKSEEEPNHAERGVPLAREVAGIVGLDATVADTIAELVRLHLALPECALHEDLDDEDVILRAAGRIGSRELIAPLHVLSVADALATGPSTCTPWFDALVARLVARLDLALSPEVDGAGLVSRSAATRDEALRLLPTGADSQRAFIEAAPVRYLASRTADRAVHDARLVSALTNDGALSAQVAVADGPTADTALVTVASKDRPRLLSRLTGAFALSGLDILAFDAYGVTGGVALDGFTVRSATARALEPETFARLERLVVLALRDRYELTTRLDERRRHYPARAFGEPVIEIRQGGWDTVLSVETADRVGLLHDIAVAVSETGLDIRWARARTIDGVANDTFHVVGEDGGPVDDPGVLGHLAMRLRGILP